MFEKVRKLYGETIGYDLVGYGEYNGRRGVYWVICNSTSEGKARLREAGITPLPTSPKLIPKVALMWLKWGITSGGTEELPGGVAFRYMNE